MIDIAKDYAVKFYNSKQWRDCRRSYISKVHGLCEHCFKEGKHVPGYIVDHIEEITPVNINDPEITLNHDNLQYLCLECHNTKTFGKDVDVIRDGLMFDRDGNIVEI
ncbi:MAG TPA: HNH endonuclease [Tissierellaceae bacterium]|nr:HNH endonuclease [Tissierellaceae bacterium]